MFKYFLLSLSPLPALPAKNIPQRPVLLAAERAIPKHARILTLAAMRTQLAPARRVIGAAVYTRPHNLRLLLESVS
jgi:hypothetical protein